jgi:hypothetical protein
MQFARKSAYPSPRIRGCSIRIRRIPAGTAAIKRRRMLNRLKAIIYSGIGHCHLRTGQFSKAAAHFSELIRLFPNDPSPM